MVRGLALGVIFEEDASADFFPSEEERPLAEIGGLTRVACSRGDSKIAAFSE